MEKNTGKKKLVFKKALKVIAWIIVILLTIQLGLFVNFAIKATNKNSTHWAELWKTYEELYPIKWEYYTIMASRDIAQESILTNKYTIFQKPLRWVGLIAYYRAKKVVPDDEMILYILKYRSELDANTVNSAGAWEIYDTALHDIRLVNEGKVHTAVKKHLRPALVAATLGEITKTLINPNFSKMLKRANSTGYRDAAKEFCKVISENNIPKTDKKDLLSNDLSRQLYCLIFRTTTYLVDHDGTPNKACNSSGATELIRQFNLFTATFKKAKEENVPVSSLPAAIDIYRLKILSVCPNRANELKQLPN